MIGFGDPGYWALAATTTALNVPFGRLRAGAPRRSPRWFGVHAAAVLLLLGMRRAFAVSVLGTLALIAAMVLGQWLGRKASNADCEPSPLRWRTVTYAALVAGLILMIGAPAYAQGNDWKRLDADEPAPAFSLTDQDGKSVALKDFRGKVTILTFMYTECRDICPVLPQILARVDQRLTETERARVRFIGITIDPRRDTPEKMRAFMQSHGLEPSRWTLLTGSLAQLTQAAADYGVVVRPDAQGELVHNAVFVLIASGRLRTEFHGLSSPTDEIVKAVRSLLHTRKK